MPLIKVGGVEKNLFLISNHLSKKNEIFICTGSTESKKKFNKKIKFISPKKNLNMNLNIKFHYIICLFLLLKFLIKKKNSVVFAFQGNIYCVLLCKILNIKVIARSNSSPSGWNHGYLKKIIYKFIMKKANLIIVNSKNFHKEMKNIYNLKTICIYNPFNTKDLKIKSKEKIKNKFFDKKDNCIKLINLGRLTDQKDQITILKAVNLIKSQINFKLIIVGQGYEKKNLESFINQNNLEKNVKILNFLDNPFPILKKSDVFILSSKYEGLPNVLLEAAFLKKYIITTNCPTGPDEILKNNIYSTFFNVGNYYQLSEKIKYYSKQKEKIKKNIKKNNFNSKKFDYGKNLKIYENEIKKIMNKL